MTPTGADTPTPAPSDTPTPSQTPSLTPTGTGTETVPTPADTMTLTPTWTPTPTQTPVSCILPSDVTGDLPAADTYIYRVKSDTNYGNDVEINVRAESHPEMHGLLQFDLSMIPADATITGATLYLYTPDSRNGLMFSIRRITTEWDEQTATWNTPWLNPGSDYDDQTVYGSFTIGGRGCFIQTDMTNLVDQWTNGTYDNFGLLIHATGPMSIVHFVSSDDSLQAELRPRLSVTYSLPGE